MALDTARDIGKDGGLTARDAYGFQLNYFTGDYLPINASRNPFPGHSAYIGAAYRPLYNGNISSMAVNIGKLNQPQLYNYEYDQLNRLVSMQAWRGFTSSTNSWSGMTATSDHQERITYDANGNIMSYSRNGNTSAGKPLDMDKLAYYYALDGSGNKKNNQLLYVFDTVALATNYTEDIDRQSAGNYEYDSIGNLTRDNAEKISAITWNVYGKISQITKTASTVVGDLQLIRYGYDASGNRIRKTAYYNQDATNYRAAHTWYVRDASGNVMATYISAGLMPKTSTRDTTSKVPLYLSELHMYGSSRLGIWSRNVNMDVLPTGGGTAALLGSAGIDTFNRGNKFFELSNHLGNVLVTVSDRKFGQSPVNNLYTSFTADVVSATDYAPFGMQMVGRRFDAARSTAYRYGFNGKENDNEVKGEGNQQDYGMRIYDPRLGRFFSEDPITKKYPELTPYQFASNTPIWAIDLDGLEGLGNTTCGVYSIYTGKMMVQGDVNNDMVVDRSERESFLKAMGATYVVGSAFLADVAFTKGKASQLLFTYTPLAAAFEHNRAKTPQGRVAQDQRAKESLSEAFISYGVSSLIGGFIRMTTATKDIQYLFREEDFKKLVFDPDKGKVTADAIQELRVALTAESKIGTVKGRADQGSGADFITSIGLVDIKNVKKFIDAANGTQKEFLKMVGTMKANKNVKYVIDFEGSNLNSEQFESLMKKFYDAGVNRAQVVTTGVSSVNNTKIKTF